MRPLSDLKSGETAYIVDLRCYFTGLEVVNNGVFPGDVVKILKNEPKDSELSFASGQKKFKIKRHNAKTVITHFISYTFNLN